VVQVAVAGPLAVVLSRVFVSFCEGLVYDTLLCCISCTFRLYLHLMGRALEDRPLLSKDTIVGTTAYHDHSYTTH